ncbi:hypothetical protein HPB52_001679 [Rhipicephalus sanguineus]|uniref:Chitinase n=1 Tax=Rhipicephalus sanguineus TaxID=34632 RepID=A0A9D4PWD9_RHISA|nr:hypothetical protein HPB52_001679 [Rhipicephalus sanguineus]
MAGVGAPVGDAANRPATPEHARVLSTPYPAIASNVSDYSSPIRERRESKRCLFTLCVFCVVGAVTMAVPLALVLLPLLVGESRYTVNYLNISFSPSSDGSQSRPPETETPGVLTRTTRQAVTANVPPSCRRESPRVSDDLVNVNAQPLSPTLATLNGTESVYCLYNNSRFRKPRGHDFLTVHVPWWFCSRLIYWSVGIDKGKLTSRAENFDRIYGLYKLRVIADTYREGVELLMTVGGYPEDTGQLYALGSGTNESYSLAKDVAETVYYTGFNGVNLHLVEDPSCERYFTSQYRWLSDFIDVLSERIQINFATFPFKITAMVGADRIQAKNYVRYLEGRVDFVFYDTHNLISTSGSMDAYCSKYYEKTEALLRELRNVKNTTFCGSLSFIMPSRSNDDRTVASLAHTISKREGFVSRLDFCVEQRTVVNGSDIAGCSTYTSGSPWEVSAFPNRSALRTAFGQKCLWLMDIDFDSYNSTECAYLGAWAMLREVYAALSPRPPSRF